ncbi:DNRLRE domain-containing protein [Paenibacillus sp. NPDC056579]|uniref:CBM96 family carbohydrate-binding protein n=1 Tax=Paenibacillus sp. NPDC056579 TaxID=3345871 RepID=UPI003680EDD9
MKKTVRICVLFLFFLSMIPLFHADPTAFAATYTVPAGDVASLRSYLANAQPGDIIQVSGTYNVTDGTIATSRSGTAGNYITIRGTGSGAIFNYTASAGNASFHIKHGYYKLENITINSNSQSNKGLLIEASHGYVTNVTVKNTLSEAFKIRKNSQYWLFENCVAQEAGKSGKFGEGFYVGDADQNWTTAPNPDQSGYITFLNCSAIKTKNDGFDFKEGTHHIKVIGSTVDFQNTVPESTVGNNGLFMRANNVQVINTTVKNNAGTGQGFRTSKLTASDGVSYGSNLELKKVTATNLAGAMIYTNYSSNKLYTDYTMTSVAGGLHASGSNTATSTSPSSFNEMTWSGEGGAVYGGGQTPPTTVSLTATADSFVRGGTEAGNNFGSLDTMTVKLDANASLERKGYLKFNTSTLSGSATSATLKLYLTNLHSNTTTYTVEARGLTNDSWSESAITGSNQPTEAGTVLDTAEASAEGTYISFDVTSFVNSQTDGTVSFRLVGLDTSLGGDYATKEHATASFRPVLEVTGS